MWVIRELVRLLSRIVVAVLIASLTAGAVFIASGVVLLALGAAV